MITDAVLGFLISAVGAVLELLPAMPEGAGSGGFWKFIGAFDYLVPVAEFIAFLPVVAGTFVALGVFRVIRLLNPLGS